MSEKSKSEPRKKTGMSKNCEFGKYPSMEIVSEAMDSVYRFRWIECVREGGLVRFLKYEKKVPKNSIDDLLSSLMDVVVNNGK